MAARNPRLYPYAAPMGPICGTKIKLSKIHTIDAEIMSYVAMIGWPLPSHKEQKTFLKPARTAPIDKTSNMG